MPGHRRSRRHGSTRSSRPGNSRRDESSNRGQNQNQQQPQQPQQPPQPHPGDLDSWVSQFADNIINSDPVNTRGNFEAFGTLIENRRLTEDTLERIHNYAHQYVRGAYGCGTENSVQATAAQRLLDETRAALVNGQFKELADAENWLTQQAQASIQELEEDEAEQQLLLS